MAAALFWVSTFVIVYHHILYPIFLRTVADAKRVRNRTNNGSPATALPSVTVIVPAHNEESVITAKIANIAQLRYDPDKMTIIIAFDGCTDQTAAIGASALEHVKRGDNFRLVEYRQNVGKVAVLNDQIASSSSELIALSDASTALDSDALVAACLHFSNPDVGVVCATYRLNVPSSEGERAYWDYQTKLKAAEATLGAPMGAHGAFYLFRRSLWSPLPADTINDDFVLPLRIVAQGFRAVYDTSIVATEMEQSKPHQEFRRRVRIAAGNLQQVWLLRDLANPRRPGLSFVFLSGKALRAFMPLVVLIAVATSAILAMNSSWLYKGIFAAEVTALTVALGSAMLAADRPLPKGLAWLRYMAVGYIAGAVGAFLLIAGFKNELWRFSTTAKKGATSGA